MNEIIKAILKAISWFVFFLMGVAACISVICTLGGITSLIISLLGVNLVISIYSWAVGYFGSMGLLILGCIIFSIYEFINKRVNAL